MLYLAGVLPGAGDFIFRQRHWIRARSQLLSYCAAGRRFVLWSIRGDERLCSPLIAETVVIVTFLLISAIGFEFDPWFVVAGLATHGILDFVHADLIQNLGVPIWWPMFCLIFDITAGAYLAWHLRSGNLLDRGK